MKRQDSSAARGGPAAGRRLQMNCHTRAPGEEEAKSCELFRCRAALKQRILSTKLIFCS